MSKQTDINGKMRAILIDWLVEVHLKFKLMPETLFLTHNLIDRFLSKKVVTRKNLQVREGPAVPLVGGRLPVWRLPWERPVCALVCQSDRWRAPLFAPMRHPLLESVCRGWEPLRRVHRYEGEKESMSMCIGGV